MDRPLTDREIRYLEAHKALLDAAWQALWLTGVLVALPLGFLASALLGHSGGWSAERWATVGASLILVLLVGAIVGFTPRETGKRMGLKEIRRRFALGHDLAEGVAAEETLVVTAKDARRQGQPGPDGNVPRAYFMQAGGREFQLSGVHWMAVAIGAELVVSYAPHSGVVLAIDGDADRLALPARETPRGGDQLPFGDGF